VNTKTEAQAAVQTTLREFMGSRQRMAVGSLFRCEEKQFFFDKMCELAKTVTDMPKTYEQDGKGDEAVAHLHYFAGGSGNWWITEKDMGSEDEPGQHQAFGLVDLGCGPELGYISIVELLAAGAELDFHFRPTTIGKLKEKIDARHEAFANATA
jgi:hypothetical protein